MSGDSRFHERIEAALVHTALFAAQFLQVGQTAEGGKAGIGDIEVSKEMQGELQPLKVLHSGDHFWLGVTFELAAAPGVKAEPGKKSSRTCSRAARCTSSLGSRTVPVKSNPVI